MHSNLILLALARAAAGVAALSYLTATELVEPPKWMTSEGDIIILPEDAALGKRGGIPTYHYTGLIGGSGGSYYADHFKDNTYDSGHYPNWSYGATAIVKKLTIWWQNDDVGLHGIQVTYQDGTRGPVHGRKDGTEDSLDIKVGVRVTGLWIWGNGIGTRTGRLRLILSDGQDWQRGKDRPGDDGYEQDIGGTSGLLTGVFGRSGDAIDCLGFTFIMPVHNQRVTNMAFDDDVIGTDTNVGALSYKTYEFTNNGDVMQPSQSASDTLTFTATETWTQQLSLELGISYTIKAGVPALAEATTGYSWKITSITSTTVSWSTSESFASNPRCDVPAHSTCTVQVLMTKGELQDLSYSADVRINVNGWDGWFFQERGRYGTVSYGNIKQVTSIAKNS